MKTFVTFIVLIILVINQVLAQHSSNQMKFKTSNIGAQQIRTPRYRHDVTGSVERGYSEDERSQITSSQNSTPSMVAQSTNEMILECSALINVKADSYLAIFNLTQVGETAQDADAQINKRASAFIEALKTLGIQPANVYSDMIYLIPIFEYETEKRLFSKTYNEVPKGFEMQKNLHIRFKKSDLVDDIVTLAAASEIYDLVTVEYFVKDCEAYYDTIRTQAADFIAKNAVRLKKVGLNLDNEFRTVAENSAVVYPESQYSDYESFVSQSLDAAKNKTVTTMRKPKTVAYNKLSYNDFDIVLHPEFLEPVVQYTYKLQVKYTLNKEKLEPKNNYFIVDPAGNMKQLQIK